MDGSETPRIPAAKKSWAERMKEKVGLGSDNPRDEAQAQAEHFDISGGRGEGEEDGGAGERKKARSVALNRKPQPRACAVSPKENIVP